MTFPIVRPRRLRKTDILRRMVRETILTPADFIWPIFIVPGKNIKTPISSLKNQNHMSPDIAAIEAEKAFKAGVPAVILFGLPETKDEIGSGAWDKNGPVQLAAKAIKDKVPDMIVICDTCLCEYTDHGHCGPIAHGGVDNDATLPLLARTAVSQAQAGADMIAPSDMMDGRVAAIRAALDAEGFTDIPIMSYSAKYSSAFYGPFREAAQSAPSFGDRKAYQMDPANAREAIKETALDIEEGADIVMVKPALAYLDIIRQVKDTFDLPVAAYQVSGEFAMVMAGAQLGLLDEQAVMMESLTSIKRAGADMILTYYAIEAARLVG